MPVPVVAMPIRAGSGKLLRAKMKEEKMKTTKRISIIALVILMMGLSTAFGAANSVEIMAYLTDIRVYLDDKPLTLLDGNGNVIKPLIYNGTSYLPVKSISENLDIAVSWDGSTRTIYLGKHSSKTPIAYLNKMDHIVKNKVGVYEDEFIKDNMNQVYLGYLEKNYEGGTSGYIDYAVNDMYSKVKGTIIIKAEDKDRVMPGINSFVEIWGDDRLLYKSINMTSGTAPVDFDVSLEGVRRLKVVFTLDNTALVNGEVFQ